MVIFHYKQATSGNKTIQIKLCKVGVVQPS